jgi:thiamine biosynthesis protein ThiS
MDNCQLYRTLGARAPAQAAVVRSKQHDMTIKLNGDPHEIQGPLSVSELLHQLEIDARRVAVELNLAVVKKAAYDSSVINEGDEVEVVNFVGGG